MRRLFLITSLVAAGFGTSEPLAAQVFTATTKRDDRARPSTLFGAFRQDHPIRLAQHRSHSSHSSHRSSSGGGHYSHSSHTSHRSSTGGYDGGYAPAPVYSPPTRTRPSSTGASSGTYGNTAANSLYSAPSSNAESEAQSGAATGDRTKLFKAMVERVQIALLGQGLFHGTIDGAVGPATRRALRAYQKRAQIEQTGTITPETLTSLNVNNSP